MIDHILNWLRLKPPSILRSMKEIFQLAVEVVTQFEILSITGFVGAMYSFVLFASGFLNANWMMVLSSLYVGPLVTIAIIAMIFVSVLFYGTALDITARIAHYVMRAYDWITGRFRKTDTNDTTEGTFEPVSDGEARRYYSKFKHAGIL